MADNANSVNTAEMPSFSALKGYQRRAVLLRYDGKTYEQIANHINDEFVLTYKERSVGEWFIPGGTLEAAYHELMDLMAKQSLKEARQKLKSGSLRAVDVLLEKIESSDEKVQVRAALGLLAKYIPDKQLVLDAPEAEEDLPPELTAVANEIATEIGENHGPDPVDDAQQSPGTDQAPGDGDGETLP